MKCCWFSNYSKSSDGSLETSKMPSLRRRVVEAALRDRAFLTGTFTQPPLSLLFNKSIVAFIPNMLTGFPFI